jgi:serine phosphatase RsbU (regulator of sigma subunit)/anti-sigma regulatory factor (Ser/Thr protein kinase)
VAAIGPPGPPPVLAAAMWRALDMCEDGVTVLALDGTVVYVNPASAAMADRRVEDSVGRNIWAEYPELVGGPFHDAIQAAAESGGPVRWRAFFGPLRGWYSDVAERVGDHIVVVYSREDEQRDAERARQRLTAQVQDALDRSRMLLAASERFTAAFSVDDVVDGLQQLTGTALGPASVGLYLRDPAQPDTLLRLRPEEVDDGARPRYERVPLSEDLPVAACVRSGRAEFHPDVGELADHPQLREDLARIGTGAFAVVPVPGADGAAGAIVLMWRAPRVIDVSDRAVLVTLASYVGAAVARIRATEQRVTAAERRYEQTRSTVLTMQRSLLPTLPVLPGLDVVAHYAPAETELSAGGDWYDAVLLPDGRTALVVGDVVGHGPLASAAMGQLRVVLEHLLLSGVDPVEALAQLDTAAGRSPATRAATVAVALLEPGGRTTWSSRGHPPPVVVRGDGTASALPGRIGGPLGTGSGTAPAHVHAVDLALGDALLLCSDGLLERPGRDPLSGTDELVATLTARRPLAGLPVADGAVDALQRTCAELAASMAHDADDDVTLLLARRRAPTAPLRRTVVADPSVLRDLRAEVDAWLDALRVQPDDQAFLELALTEAVTNAIEHGYRDGPAGSVRIVLELDGESSCCLSVEDDGRWRTPDADPATRGRGLQMIRSLATEAEVRSTGRGTTVVVRRTLHRLAVHSDARGPAPAPPPAEQAYRSTLVRGTPALLELAGVLDMTSEDRLRSDLLHAGRGGAVPLIVDLDAVSLLASAAVRVLHEAAVPLGARLRAAPGTPARAVLHLGGLGELLEDRDRRTAAPA